MPLALGVILVEQGKIVGVSRAHGNSGSFTSSHAFLISDPDLKKDPCARGGWVFLIRRYRKNQPRAPREEARTTGLVFFLAATLFLLLRLVLAVALW